MAAVTQNVDVWERNVHRHRAKLPALGVKVEAVTDFVPAVTAVLAFSVDQRNFNLGSAHLRHGSSP